MNDNKIESFFLTFKECYQKISPQSEKTTLQIKLGDTYAHLHFSNPELKEIMSRSLTHLIEQETEYKASLNIYCFEGDLSFSLFQFPWTVYDFEVQGLIKGFNTERFQSIYQHGSGAIILFDNQSKEGIYYIESHLQIPYWEISFPFRTIFHWWTRDTPYQLLHAGGIGFQSSSMIISGKSGSGKSSTCLSGLLHKKIFIAGDDYILVNVENKILYSLYHCAKIEWSNLSRLNFLEEFTAPEFSEAEKAMIFIEEQITGKMLLRSNLNFSLVPQVSLRNKTVIIESSPSVSLKSLAPTTLFQLPLGREETFRKCVSLNKELSVFEALLGTNPQEIAETLYTFLEDHKTVRQ